MECDGVDTGILLIPKFVIVPIFRVVDNVFADPVKFVFIAYDVFMKPGLPFKLKSHPVCVF